MAGKAFALNFQYHHIFFFSCACFYFYVRLNCCNNSKIQTNFQSDSWMRILFILKKLALLSSSFSSSKNSNSKLKYSHLTHQTFPRFPPKFLSIIRFFLSPRPSRHPTLPQPQPCPHYLPPSAPSSKSNKNSTSTLHFYPSSAPTSVCLHFDP